MLEQPRQLLIEQFGVQAFAQFAQVTSEHLSELAALAENGALKIHLDATFPLDMAAALELVEKHSQRHCGDYRHVKLGASNPVL